MDFKCSQEDFKFELATVLDEIEQMLIAKNAAYGNSALDPVRIFSKASPEEQIRVRIDDKLSRLSRGSNAGEDPELDLLGYLVLLRIAKKKQGQTPFEYTGPYRFPPDNKIKFFCLSTSELLWGLPSDIDFNGEMQYSGTEVKLINRRYPLGIIVSKKDLPPVEVQGGGTSA